MMNFAVNQNGEVILLKAGLQAARKPDRPLRIQFAAHPEY